MLEYRVPAEWADLVELAVAELQAAQRRADQRVAFLQRQAMRELGLGGKEWQMQRRPDGLWMVEVKQEEEKEVKNAD